MNKLKIAITTVAFSSDNTLINILKKEIPADLKINKPGKRLTREELKVYLKDCNAAIVGLDKIDNELLSLCPDLRVISKYGVGLDNIDIASCKKHGVEVLYSQGINKRSVAELTLGLILSLMRNIQLTSNKQKNGKWFKNGGIQLTNKTVGIIGVGNIGKEVVTLLKPFNCKILVNDIINQDEYYKANNLIETTKEIIFKSSDIVTIHTSLNKDTENLINTHTLSKMKNTAFLINTARGEIVNEGDLKNALINGVIAGAGLDVYTSEPPADYELIKLENLICTPHIGGNSKEAVFAMGISAINNLKNFYKEVHNE